MVKARGGATCHPSKQRITGFCGSLTPSGSGARRFPRLGGIEGYPEGRLAAQESREEPRQANGSLDTSNDADSATHFDTSSRLPVLYGREVTPEAQIMVPHFEP